MVEAAFIEPLVTDTISNTILDDVLLALALGALVGMERDRIPEEKYAGVRTLSLLCAAGPLAVHIARLSASALPVMIYLSLGAVFALLIVHIRMHMEQQDLGLTTSASVFLVTVVGVIAGYAHRFEAVAVTLIAVLFLSEKSFFTRYTEMLSAEEISDAVKLGILAFVLYPVLPTDPIAGVVPLQQALLFVIFILLIQFAAFVSLKWLKTRISFLAAAFLGGIVSSLAVVTTMVQFVTEEKVDRAAYAGSVAAVVAAVCRNGVVAAVLAPVLIDRIAGPFLAAAAVGAVFTAWFYWSSEAIEDVEFGADSPFSFTAAFKFGVFFLLILVASEAALQYFSTLGVYGTAFLGGIASSTAVVASAVTLLGGDAGTVTASQAAVMIVLGTVSSLLTKLVYAVVGGARSMAYRLVVPYLLVSAALLLVLL